LERNKEVLYYLSVDSLFIALNYEYRPTRVPGKQSIRISCTEIRISGNKQKTVRKFEEVAYRVPITVSSVPTYAAYTSGPRCKLPHSCLGLYCWSKRRVSIIYLRRS
jgi:hypothetical protein